MKKQAKKILERELNESIYSLQEISGLGSVNKIFSASGERTEYIFRLNEDAGKKLEYKKEEWCIKKVASLGIPSPEIIRMGFEEDMPFMIQKKIVGINGKLCEQEQKAIIWKKLGTYAAKYHTISRIEDEEIERNEFHENWQARLDYNIHELNDDDNLLDQGVFTKKEQQIAKRILANFRGTPLKTGLVHGDLCPRNVIWAEDNIYLLDWGTAEINVVPHSEIGIILMSNEATKSEFYQFLEGLGISISGYKKIENEINILNLLHTLDKYRWAENYDVESIENYGKKVAATFAKIS